MVEDNDETTCETDTSTKSTSVESEISTAQLPSSHPREQPKTHDCLSAPTTIEPTTKPLDCSSSLSVTLPQNRGEQTAREDDHEAAMTIHPYSVIAATPLFPEHLQGQRHSVLDEEEE